MAFLDNSGDIILDAVLTDTGRMRLARGDGSFRISKFAFGDDEINYSLFAANTGSAYQDLSILQTPVLEAFTNNSSLMKSTLLSITDENLLYLPILELNEIRSSDIDRHSNGMFTVAVDKETEDKFDPSHKVMYGANPAARYIEVDQGIDSINVPANSSLSSDLVETQFLITMDRRFGGIITHNSIQPAPVAHIDDDEIANYFITTSTVPSFVVHNANKNVDATSECISGARGVILKFRIMASLDLSAGALFDDLGTTTNMTDNTAGSSSNYKYIDANIGVKGITTGYRLDLPVRFVKFNTD